MGGTVEEEKHYHFIGGRIDFLLPLEYRFNVTIKSRAKSFIEQIGLSNITQGNPKSG